MNILKNLVKATLTIGAIAATSYGAFQHNLSVTSKEASWFNSRNGLNGSFLENTAMDAKETMREISKNSFILGITVGVPSTLLGLYLWNQIFSYTRTAKTQGTVKEVSNVSQEELMSQLSELVLKFDESLKYQELAKK